MLTTSGGSGPGRGLIARRNVPSRVSPLAGSEIGCIGSATSFVGSNGGMGTIPLSTSPRPVPAKSTPPVSSSRPGCAVASGSTTIISSSPAGRVRVWPLASWSYQRGLRATDRTWRPPAVNRSTVQDPPATLAVWIETTPSPAPSATNTCASSPGTTASFVATTGPSVQRARIEGTCAKPPASRPTSSTTSSERVATKAVTVRPGAALTSMSTSGSTGLAATTSTSWLSSVPPSGAGPARSRCRTGRGAPPVDCVSIKVRASTIARLESAPVTSATPAELPSARLSRTPAIRIGRSPVSTVAGNTRIGAGTNWRSWLVGQVSAGSMPPSSSSGPLQSCRARSPSRPVLAMNITSRSPAPVAARPVGALNWPTPTVDAFVEQAMARSGRSSSARFIKGSSRRGREGPSSRERPWAPR